MRTRPPPARAPPARPLRLSRAASESSARGAGRPAEASDRSEVAAQASAELATDRHGSIAELAAGVPQDRSHAVGGVGRGRRARGVGRGAACRRGAAGAPPGGGPRPRGVSTRRGSPPSDLSPRGARRRRLGAAGDRRRVGGGGVAGVAWPRRLPGRASTGAPRRLPGPPRRPPRCRRHRGGSGVRRSGRPRGSRPDRPRGGRLERSVDRVEGPSSEPNGRRVPGVSRRPLTRRSARPCRRRGASGGSA